MRLRLEQKNRFIFFYSNENLNQVTFLTDASIQFGNNIKSIIFKLYTLVCSV